MFSQSRSMVQVSTFRNWISGNAHRCAMAIRGLFDVLTFQELVLRHRRFPLLLAADISIGAARIFRVGIHADSLFRGYAHRAGCRDHWQPHRSWMEPVDAIGAPLV